VKKSLLKFTVGLLALVFGISVVWTSGIYHRFFPSPGDTASTQIDPAQRSAGERSGKVLIRLRNFEYGKDWIAYFEIINDTEQPIFYVGSKDRYALAYCTLGVKHEEPFPANHDGKIDNLAFKVTDACYYGQLLSLQTIQPGESFVLAVDDYVVREMLNIKDPKQETKAQVGFEIFAGEDRHREILWSEEITFPVDPDRPQVIPSN
jgi:hypothetical protein